jgi:hypothetical protein
LPLHDPPKFYYKKRITEFWDWSNTRRVWFWEATIDLSGTIDSLVTDVYGNALINTTGNGIYEEQWYGGPGTWNKKANCNVAGTYTESGNGCLNGQLTYTITNNVVGDNQGSVSYPTWNQTVDTRSTASCPTEWPNPVPYYGVSYGNSWVINMGMMRSIYDFGRFSYPKYTGNMWSSTFTQKTNTSIKETRIPAVYYIDGHGRQYFDGSGTAYLLTELVDEIPLIWETNWSPDPSEICLGQEFTQTKNTLNSSTWNHVANRQAIGTKADSLGCTDPCASNFNPNATCDNGSCVNISEGCTNECSSNYNPSACRDDGSCNYDYGNCPWAFGCTDYCSSNYDPNAFLDDGSCLYDNANC